MIAWIQKVAIAWSSWIKKKLRDADDPNGLWRIGISIGLVLFVAFGVAALVIVLAWRRFEPDLDTATVGDFLRLVTITLGVVAGGGGSVALVVAYRRQKVLERGETRLHRAESRESTRLFNERFQSASAQLGHGSAAVRLAGVYAMAHLADDWDDQRQMCIDVLCGVARTPAQATSMAVSEVQAAREVPRTILSVVAAHVRSDADVSWKGYDFDLRGVEIDQHVDFRGVTFGDGVLSFDDAAIGTGGALDFEDAVFAGAIVNLARVRVRHPIIFTRTVFSAGVVQADQIDVNGDGFLTFTDATFSGAAVHFDDSLFAGGAVDFNRATFKSGKVSFSGAEFGGSEVVFHMADFVGGDVTFHDAKFVGGRIDLFNPEVWSKPPEGLPEPAPPLH